MMPFEIVVDVRQRVRIRLQKAIQLCVCVVALGGRRCGSRPRINRVLLIPIGEEVVEWLQVVGVVAGAGVEGVPGLVVVCSR